MIKSIRLQWIARLFKKGERATQRSDQATSRFDATTQMSSRDYLGLCNQPFRQNSSGNQFDLNNPGLNAVNSSLVEINKGCAGVSYDLNSFSGSGHRSFLLFIDASGQAYDLSGQKWSRVA